MPCTVASLLPFAVKEPRKPGLVPGEFPINPSDGKTPSLLIVKDCVRSQFNEDFKPIPLPVPDAIVASSIVGDYLGGQQLVTPEACPGIFWVDGAYTQEEFEKKFGDKIKEAIDRQIAWFQNLTKAADDIWQQHHQHKFITDLQRTAARTLNYKREWLDDSADRIVKCPACMTLISKEAAICFACKAIVNAEKAAQFQFAGQYIPPAPQIPLPPTPVNPQLVK